MHFIIATSVSEIFGKFGVNFPLLIGNSLTFLAVAAILYYFVFKPVMAKSAERISIIEKGLSDAQKSKEALSNSQKAASEELAKASSEAMQIMTKAKESAKSLLEKAKLEASEQAAIFTEKGIAQIEQDRQKMLVQLKQELSGLVAQAASKAVADILTDEQKRKIAENAIKDMTK